MKRICLLLMFFASLSVLNGEENVDFLISGTFTDSAASSMTAAMSASLNTGLVPSASAESSLDSRIFTAWITDATDVDSTPFAIGTYIIVR